MPSIEKLRLEYGNTIISEKLEANPIRQFKLWLNEAIKAKVIEPNGMTLATVSSANRPASRTVLLKKIDRNGLIFFTSYLSRKGEHMRLHPYASATFWWREIYRQVNFEGKIKKLNRRSSVTYFHRRPKRAQLAALASTQSAPLVSRLTLEENYKEVQKKYRNTEVPCPKDWGGYYLEPERVEFWQGRKNRLHDRVLYIKDNGGWILTRLFP